MPESPITFRSNKAGIGTLTLNRPEKRNAFHPDLIHALHHSLDLIENDEQVRVLMLCAEGKHFCAGADLNWMQEAASYSHEQNKQDAMQLANLLERLNTFSKPTIAVVQGRAMGGGIGLIACCDIVVASDDAAFCFSEVKLGLIPATIAPYILHRLGYRATRRYFISAEDITADEAHRIGLVDELTPYEHLLDRGQSIAMHLTHNAPLAMAAAKELTQGFVEFDRDLIDETATLLAEIRSSSEAKEGIEAFFQKRKPNWMPKG